MRNKKLYTFTVPAGRYYLGDPCYAIADKHWSQWLDNAGLDNRDDHMMLKGTIEGSHEAYAFCTAHGDGIYNDQHDREFGVDAGLIGLVPLAYLEENNVKIEKDWTIITFDRPTHCSSLEGTLRFGDIRIHTEWDDEE